jgi:hypothetical protein
MTEEFSPIRVLLLDDQPEHGLMPLDRTTHERLVPRVPADIEDASFDPRWFDVRWLATPGEAREFRDFSAQLALADPLALGAQGWVPDILVVDYMLTAEGRCRAVAERLRHKPESIERASALAAVKALSGRFQLQIDDAGKEYEAEVAGDENFGCFLGGLLLTTFFGYSPALAPLARRGSFYHTGPRTRRGFRPAGVGGQRWPRLMLRF